MKHAKNKKMLDISSYPDILTLILQRCETIQILANASVLSKVFNALVMRSASGRQTWLALASSLTGHDAKAHIQIHCDDFHARLKLLVCPWLSIPRKLRLSPSDPLLDQDDMCITLADQDSIALWHRADDEFKAIGVCSARPENRRWKFTAVVEDLTPPRTPARRLFQLIAPPPQLQLSNQHDCHYLFQHIHQSALAIIELPQWDMEHRSGIYFFRNSDGKATKLLRHIMVGAIPSQSSMIIRPMEMWLLTEEGVLYFGPSGKMLSLTVAGRIDRALWYAGAGKARSAMRSLLTVGATDINTPCVTGNMTVLHMATFQSKPNTARTLLEAKGDPEARDDQNMTCVMIAASLESPDMIRVLCEEGGDHHHPR